MFLDGIISSKGWFRTIGSILCFAGVYVAPHIAVIAPFADAMIQVGAAIGGVGIGKVAAKKIA